MSWIDFIFIEAIKSLAQAIRITFMLFWWIGLGIIGVTRHVSERVQENQVKGQTFRFGGAKSSSQTCPTCSAQNEADDMNCFSCGTRLS